MISIIVPVYNAENTLVRCVESILTQSYAEKEIIIVNDGSKDNSLDVARDLAEKHESVVVIDKPNGGVSSARNEGLHICHGDLVTFVDSDDYYVERDYIANMMNAYDSDEIDMVISGFVKIGIEGERCFDIENKVLTREELARSFIQYRQTGLLNSPCNKLFRKSSISEGFNEKMNMGEDAVFVLSCLHNCKRIAFCSGCGYGYVFRNTSSTADYRKKCAYDLVQTNIYHSAIRNFWEQNLPVEEVAVNYLCMRTEAVYRMLFSVLQKNGILEYLRHNIAPIIEDDHTEEYRCFADFVSKSYPYYKLMMRFIYRKAFSCKCHILFLIMKNRIRKRK